MPASPFDVPTAIPDRSAAVAGSSLVAPLCAAAFGLILLYVAGFAPTDVLHNGAHDARHAAGFACH
ncbi:MAG TPA: CbtB-domain containing protein [Casimicrobiaceae bacterium]|jgi:cobalt transporter subunit CbtB